MTHIEDVILRKTMDADVVCISDDDEREDECNKAVQSATNKMKTLGFHYNVYENSYYVPESVRIQLELIAKQQKQQKLQDLQQTQLSPQSKTEPVVYVPDDCEEEYLLIGPIRKLAHEILFGDKLHPPSTEFPYDKLIEMEKHLAKSLRSVSFPTETNVWDFVLEQLNCIRFAYHGIIDVRKLILNSFDLFIQLLIIILIVSLIHHS